MAGPITDIAATALLIVDLQNDFIHPDGAYAKGGAASPEAQALPGRLLPLVERFRALGGVQPYPSRTKDLPEVGLSTGSVGLGAALTCFTRHNVNEILRSVELTRSAR